MTLPVEYDAIHVLVIDTLLLGHYSLRVFSGRNDTLPSAFSASVEMII